MKRILTLSTNGCLVKILLVFLAQNPVLPQEQNGIFFDVNDQPLNAVLDSLINQYHISVVYQDSYLENITISSKCSGCTEEEAISMLLKNTVLHWAKKNNQYIIISEKGWNDPYRITGYILDEESGEFIPHANISVLNTFSGSISNENGFFNISGITTEQCTLRVSYIGYELEKLLIRKREARNSIININLTPTILSSKNVNVIGNQVNIMEQGEQISQISYSPRNVAMLPNLGENDVLRSLQLLPGIQGGNTGSAGLYIRGGTPDQNQILLDGMTLYQTDHFFGFVSSINALAVKDIQVYKGGIPARYGGRVNSVINMTGKNGDMNKTRISLFTNQLSSGFSLQQPLFNRGSFLLTHRQTFTDQLHTNFYDKIHRYLSDGSGLNVGEDVILIDSTATQTYKPEFQFSDLNAKLTVMPTSRDIVSLSFYTSKDILSEDSSFDFEKTGYIHFRKIDDTEWLNDGLSLKFSHQWKNAAYSQWQLSQSMYNSNHVLTTESVSILPDTIVYNNRLDEQNSIEDITFHFNHEWVLNNQKLESGLWLSNYSTNFEVKQQDSIQIIPLLEINGQILSLYFQDKMNVFERGSIITGFRASKYSINKQWALLPRMSVHYKLTPNSKIMAAWGRHIQYLHRFSNDFISSGSKFVWLLSSDTLKPIEADQFVLGYHHSFKDIVLNVEYYYNDKLNVPNFSRLHHYPNYLFPADAYDSGLLMQGEEISQGIEVLVKKSSGKFHGWMSYNYGMAKWKFNELNEQKFFPSGHDRTHDFKTVMLTNVGNWQLTFSWLYFSGRAFTANENLVVNMDEDGNVFLEADSGTFIHQSRLPDSHRLDLSIMRFSDWGGYQWEYGLSLFNVYNNKYISHKRYTFVSKDKDILVNDVEIMDLTPTIYFKISR